MTDADRARLVALISDWRKRADRHNRHGDSYRIGEGWGLTEAADELATLLPPVGQEEPRVAPVGQDASPVSPDQEKS